MTTSENISRAYSIQDTRRFIDEAVASYEQMLRQDNGPGRSTREGYPIKRDLLCQTRPELAFKGWLEGTFGQGAACDFLVDMPVLPYGIFERQEIQSSPASVMPNYGGSNYSLEQWPEYELHQSDDVFLDCCCGKHGTKLLPLKSGNSVKSPTCSWSDSGYCCDKSDSGNSRFSSLSFSGCSDTEDNCNKELKEWTQDSEGCWTGGTCVKKFNDSHTETCNEDFPGLQLLEMERYNPEEVKVLLEIMNNPENFHETTKELSDMARDVSSKRKHSKTLSGIGRFFRSIVRNVRKYSTDKSKLKLAAKEFEWGDENTNINQRRWSSRSCRSPFQKRSSPAKAKKSFVFPVEREALAPFNGQAVIRRYSAEKGVSSQTQRDENFRMVRRSESCDIIRQLNFVDDNGKFIDQKVEAKSYNFSNLRTRHLAVCSQQKFAASALMMKMLAAK